MKGLGVRPGVWAYVLAGLLACAAATSCTRSADAPPELRLFAWSEYVPRAIIDGFTERTGIRVSYDSYSSNEEMLAKLFSGAVRYDLVQPSEYTAEAMIAASALEPLDHDKIPNLKHVAPEFLNLPHDPEQRFTVPYMGGTVGIVVDTERVKDEVRGYRDVFRPEHAGRIVVVDDPREMVTWALVSEGHRVNDITPETLEKVRPVLARWLPMVRVFDSDSPKTALLNGDVDLGIVWSGEAALLWRENPKYRFILPEEGAHRFVDSLAIPAGARNRDAAHAFMNYILEPEVSRQLSREFPYTNPNLAARRLLTDEEQANPASYPPGGTELETFRDIGDVAVQVDKLVTDLKARGG